MYIYWGSPTLQGATCNYTSRHLEFFMGHGEDWGTPTCKATGSSPLLAEPGSMETSFLHGGRIWLAQLDGCAKRGVQN